MAKVSKNELDEWRSIRIHSFRVCIRFRKFLSSMALYDVIKGGIPCMGTSPGSTHTHQPERESKSTPINLLCSGYGSRRQRCTGLVWERSVNLFVDHDINNVIKEMCFWMWGKDKLVQLPKEPSIKGTAVWMRFVFLGQQWSCTRLERSCMELPDIKSSNPPIRAFLLNGYVPGFLLYAIWQPFARALWVGAMIWKQI